MSSAGKSYRTPLGRVRSLGSAKLGAQESWRMHVSAVALVPLTIGFVWLMLSLLHKDYNSARAMLGEPIPAVLMLLFVLAGLYHAELGMRSVILDYVHGVAGEWALIANTCIAVALGMACVYAVLRIGFV